LPDDIIRGWGVINEAMGGGWPPSELAQMSVEDFSLYYRSAVERIEAHNRAIEKRRNA